MARVRARTVAAAAVLVFLIVAGATLAYGQSQSANYVLQQSALSGGGGPAMSVNNLVEGTLGQEMAVGVSSSVHFVAQSGLWGFSGSGLAPVVLQVAKNPSMSGMIDLSWTGNSASYSIYRSADCSAVFSSPFATGPGHTHTDGSPLPDPLSCYNVLGTAPGPISQP